MSHLGVRIDPRSGIVDAGIETIGASAEWLRSKVQAVGRIHPDCLLAQSLAAVAEMREFGRTGAPYSFSTRGEAQSWYLRASGGDFLSKALHRGACAGLEGFDMRFKDLPAGDPVLTGPSEKSCTQRNRAWELLLGSLIATFASKVTPAEPDILCQFEGNQIGVAAKVLYSGDPGTHLDRIKDGARQIEASAADCGFVVVNLVQLFPHQAMFTNFALSSIKTNETAAETMGAWVDAFVSQYDLDVWARRLRGMDKLLSIVLFIPAVLYLHESENPMTPYYRMHIIAVGDRESRASPFEKALNWSCQTVLSFTTA